MAAQVRRQRIIGDMSATATLVGTSAWTVMVQHSREGLRWIVHTEAFEPTQACVQACQSVAREHRKVPAWKALGKADERWLSGLDVLACFWGHHRDMKPNA